MILQTNMQEMLGQAYVQAVAARAGYTTHSLRKIMDSLKGDSRHV